MHARIISVMISSNRIGLWWWNWRNFFKFFKETHRISSSSKIKLAKNSMNFCVSSSNIKFYNFVRDWLWWCSVKKILFLCSPQLSHIIFRASVNLYIWIKIIMIGMCLLSSLSLLFFSLLYSSASSFNYYHRQLSSLILSLGIVVFIRCYRFLSDSTCSTSH